MSESAIPVVATEAEGKIICPPAARKYVLLSAILASSMGFIDSTVVSLAIPAIRADLGASLVDAQWITNAYMLFLASLVLAAGAAGDVFGVRRIFGLGVAMFVITSALCAIAPDETTLILARGAQGLSAALMVPGSLALIAKSYPPEIRGQAIGTWAAFSSMTTALGPMIGSLVLSYGSDWMWRLIFAINVPFGLAVLAMLYLKVPADRPGPGRRLDVPGALLATLALGALAWGLTAYGPDATSGMLPPGAWLMAGVGLSIAFVLWERRATQPMVKLELFASRAFAGANVFTLVLFLALNAVLFFLPMTLITGWDVFEWEASLMLAPLAVFIGGMSRAAGRFSDRYGPRIPITSGALLLFVSYAALALTMPLMQLWTVTFPIMCINGLGMGLIVSPLSTAVMQAAPDEDAGLASGVNNAIARTAGLLAVAAFGALAGLVFAGSAGGIAGFEFGAFPPDGIAADSAMLHTNATNRAFQAIAACCSVVCLLAAAIAWTTQPSKEKQSL